MSGAIPPQCNFSQGGVRKVWIAPKSSADSYVYDDDNLGIIQRVLTSGGASTPFVEFDCDSTFATNDETLQRSTRGIGFAQSFTLRFAEMSYYKREVLKGLIYNRFVLVYLDRNGHYWLLGQLNGLRVADYNGTADVDRGANRYTIKVEGVELNQQRELEGSLMATSPNGLGTSRITQVPPPPLGPIVRNNLGGAGPNGGITSVLNTWLGPTGSPNMPLSQLGRQPLIELFQ